MSDDTPLPGRGIKPCVSLRSHPRLAVAAAALVLAVGVPLAWLKGAPRWQAETTLQVAPRYMKNLRDDPELDFQSNSQYRQFVEHQRRSIARPDVLHDALASLGERKAAWVLPGETERRSVERLRERLTLAAVPDTYLVQVALEGAQPEGLAEIVNAVAETFVARMRQEQFYGSTERTRTLRERERELLALIDARAAERNRIGGDLGLTTFNEGTPNPYDQLLADLRGRLAEARQRRFDADAALAAFRQRGDTNVIVRSVQESVLNDPGLNSLRSALNNRRAALLVQMSGLKPDHPGHAAAVRELAEIDTELLGQSSRLEGGVRGNLLARLQSTADQAAQVERDLVAETGRLESRATDFARLFQQATALSADLRSARAELDKVRDRIGFMEVESGSLGFVRVVTPALVPDQPFGPGRKKLLLAALAAALGAGFGVPVLRDLLDRRIRTVNDVQRLMGIPPAGWQVRRDNVAGALFGQDQLRRLAAALLRARDTRGGLVGFTAVKPAAGTTTLVLELAQTLRTLGHKVLVVEANGRARDDRFDTGRPGLLELLRGQATHAQVIAGAAEGWPPRVSVGGRGHVQLERLDRLQRVLRHWSGIADFVLVDMPPLLASADAELLARTVGQVMLVVEAGGVSRGEVQRARRLLQTLDPDAVGVVVNKVEPFVGGGYMSDLMLETLTGRRDTSVLTLPRWRLRLATLTLGWPRLTSRSTR